jgi:hypothetical protein
MEFIKKNFAILLAFTLPILLIVVVATSTYLPSLLLSTHYNFVYTSCSNGTNYTYWYNCGSYLQERYSIVNGKIVTNYVDLQRDFNDDGIPDTNNYVAHIFLHDTAKNESREITFEEAQTLTLNSLLTSPDGVTFSGRHDRNGGDFFLIFDGYSSSYGYYLTKGGGRDKLQLINNTGQEYYQDNFQFVGWVLPERN